MLKSIILSLFLFLLNVLIYGQSFNNAQWIGRADTNHINFFKDQHDAFNRRRTVNINYQSILLQKAFRVDKQISKATVNVVGLGLYELYINQEKVGDAVLTPSKTNFNKRVLYNVFDVKDQLQQGENELSIHVGNGWFNTQRKYWGNRMPYFGVPRAILSLAIKYEDGQTDTIVTDDSWRLKDGPALANCIYDGEIYDANIINDKTWSNASLMPALKGELVEDKQALEKVIEALNPINTDTLMFGLRVFDFGQNIAGRINIKVKGAQNAKVIIRHAESLKPNGYIDNQSLGEARATDVYILSGDSLESFAPSFTYHGFRYAEVSIEGIAEIIDIKAEVIHNDVKEIGSFISDNEILNQIHHCTKWSQKGAMHGVPVDCPQRNERSGWMGDVQVAMDQSLYNFELENFYKKWLIDIQLEQDTTGKLPHIAPNTGSSGAPVWTAAYPMLVWKMFKTYGDTAILIQHHSAINKYIAYQGIKGSIQRLDKFGDWANLGQEIFGSYRCNKPYMYPGDTISKWKRGTPRLLSTAFYYNNIKLSKSIAKVLGDDTLYQAMDSLAAAVKHVFNETYYDNENACYQSDQYTFQTAQVVPVYFGLAPNDSIESLVMKGLLKDIEKKAYHFNTGIIGTHYLIKLLSHSGHDELAYRLLISKGFPSYSNMLDGETTIQEHWSRKASRNHVMFGSVDAWMYEGLGGIKAIDSVLHLHPYFPNDMDSMSIKTVLNTGEYQLKWIREASKVELDITVPQATYLRLEGKLKNKKHYQFLDGADNTIKLPAGSHHLTYRFRYFKLP